MEEVTSATTSPTADTAPVLGPVRFHLTKGDYGRDGGFLARTSLLGLFNEEHQTHPSFVSSDGLTDLSKSHKLQMTKVPAFASIENIEDGTRAGFTLKLTLSSAPNSSTTSVSSAEALKLQRNTKSGALDSFVSLFKQAFHRHPEDISALKEMGIVLKVQDGNIVMDPHQCLVTVEDAVDQSPETVQLTIEAELDGYTAPSKISSMGWMFIRRVHDGGEGDEKRFMHVAKAFEVHPEMMHSKTTVEAWLAKVD